MADYQWYKMWHDVRNDAKLNALSDRQYRIWHRLLTFASEQADNRGVIVGYDDELIAVEVSFGDVEAFQDTLDRLIKFRMVERIEGGYRFVKFNKRQADTRKPSDQPEQTRERKQRSRANQRDTSDNGEMSHHVTPLSRPRHEQEEDVEEERESEGEKDTLADVAVETPPRARRASNSGPANGNGTPLTVVDLCEKIAQRTHLPKRVEVMEQLSAVIESHVARGLSLGDIWRDVLNLIDPSREKHAKRPTISQISNWLAHTHPATDLTAARASPRMNGHRPVTATTASRPIITVDDVYPD